MSEQQAVDGELTNGSALAVIGHEPSAVELHRRATDVAEVCKEIVTATAVAIQGKKFVQCEGWCAIANAHGCVLSARDVERTDTGFKAIGDVIRISDQRVMSSAEGFVGDDEPTWANRPEYAKRAMAQTRAMSRAGRSAYSYVVVLMKAGLSTTPAEEVPHGGFNDSSKPIPPPDGLDKLQSKIARPLAAPIAAFTERLERMREPVQPGQPADAPCPPYGHGRGKKLSDLDVGQLQFYESGCQRTLADATKQRFHAKEQALLDAVRNWIQFRS